MRHFFVKACPGVIMVPSGIVTSVMNCATLQFDVAVAAGVFVDTGWGMGVSVAGGGNRVTLGVTATMAGVALNKASTVCAAAVRLAC